jgi:hypothetical protein
MQKITLKEKVLEFILTLKSEKIAKSIKWLKKGKVNGTNNNENQKSFNEKLDILIQDIINSKSNYDNAIQSNPELKEISASINADSYKSENISRLISELSKQTLQTRNSIYSIDSVVEFLVFQESLINLNAVTSNTIKETQEEESVIIFTLISENNPNINLIVEVLKKLQELIDIIELIYEEEQENTIYLLDKGSNTNIGVETGIKTAKSLFQIFKEVWDWMVNRKYYKQKLRNAAFLDNLDVINKIEESKNNGALSEEDAKRYKELITKKTDELLSLNTVPRQLLLETNQQSKNQPLLDYNEIRLLTEGKK